MVDGHLGYDVPILVTGAGGFIGGHLAADLSHSGHRRIRAVDIKPIDEWRGDRAWLASSSSR